MDFCKGCEWAKSKDIDRHISFSEYYDLANGKELERSTHKLVQFRFRFKE